MSSYTDSGDGFGGGFDYRIPTWDGQGSTWHRFRKDFDWWEAGEDFSKFDSVNLGARFVKRQRGIVKSRCEEFSPADVNGKAAVKYEELHSAEEADYDPEQVGVVVVAAEPLHGIKTLLLPALEKLVGIEIEAEKAELRDIWHKSLIRHHGESVIENHMKTLTIIRKKCFGRVGNVSELPIIQRLKRF